MVTRFVSETKLFKAKESKRQRGKLKNCRRTLYKNYLAIKMVDEIQG